jgi:hypothetical protein
MREEGDEEAIARDVIFLRLATRGIHQKRDLREGVKGNADRKPDIGQRDGNAAQGGKAPGEEAGIFEIAQQQHIEGDATGQQHGAARGAAFARDGAAEREIRRDGDKKNGEIFEAGRRVEQKGGERQPDLRGKNRAVIAKNEKSRKDDGEIEKQEQIGIEEHACPRECASGAFPLRNRPASLRLDPRLPGGSGPVTRLTIYKERLLARDHAVTASGPA